MIKNLATAILFTSSASFAAGLSCHTVVQEGQFTPLFTMTAELDEGALKGVELTSLQNVQITVATDTLAIESLQRDEDYAPRTNKDRNRFNFNIETTSAEDTPEEYAFDGIAHGVILPKILPAASNEFAAYLISSTDSYHDGINSYFKMLCTVK